MPTGLEPGAASRNVGVRVVARPASVVARTYVEYGNVGFEGQQAVEQDCRVVRAVAGERAEDKLDRLARTSLGHRCRRGSGEALLEGDPKPPAGGVAQKEKPPHVLGLGSRRQRAAQSQRIEDDPRHLATRRPAEAELGIGHRVVGRRLAGVEAWKIQPAQRGLSPTEGGCGRR